MTALVTGATGFLGRHLCAHLERMREARVLRLSRKPPGGPNEIACELENETDLAAVIARWRPTSIYHLAASFVDDIDASFRCNVRIARNLLDAVAQGCPAARVVLIGSAAEYGFVEERDNPIAESTALRPTTIYGWSKAAQTQLGMVYSAARGVEVMTARLFNLDGKGAAERLFIGRVERQIEALRLGDAARITVGDLDAIRDYIDVNDACEHLLDIAELGLPGEVYNVGSGCGVRMRDVLAGKLAEAGLGFDVVDIKAFRKPGATREVRAIYADVSKLRALTGRDRDA